MELILLGPLFDKYGIKHTALPGAIGVILSVMILSICTGMGLLSSLDLVLNLVRRNRIFRISSRIWGLGRSIMFDSHNSNLRVYRPLVPQKKRACHGDCVFLRRRWGYFVYIPL
jgi:hypothetical protein